MLLSAAAVGIAVLLDRQIPVSNLSLLFVLPVVIVAVNFDLRAALTAAVIGAAGFNFFLVPPLYSFSIGDTANLWGFALLLAVAVIVSAVAGDARRRAVEAKALADQAVALQGLARDLVAARDTAAILASAREALGGVFAAPAVVLLADEAGVLAGEGLSGADLTAARTALSTRLPLRADAYPSQGTAFDFWPVITPSRIQAVIGAQLDTPEGRPADADRLADIVGGYLAVALERERFAAQAARAALRDASDRVKADLLAAVSHDLKTPLSTIQVALQSLQRFGGGQDGESRAQLIDLAEAETARLTALVGNLLDMGRIEADALAVQLAFEPLDALVALAAERARLGLAGRHLDNAVGPDAPMVMADAALTVTALGNLLDNAGKYAPAGSTVRIEAAVEGGEAVIVILDEGPGFAGEAQRLFGRFERGVAGDGRAPGTGLGLSIARGFLAAQGGSVEAADRTGRPGARVTVRLPLAALGTRA